MGDLDSIGPYRLDGVLGQGGMGVVYRATHTGTGARVALKTVTVPHEAMLASIRREIHALRQIRHPGVVGIRDQGVFEGRPWYAMELLSGHTLRDRMDGPRAARSSAPAALSRTLPASSDPATPGASDDANAVEHAHTATPAPAPPAAHSTQPASPAARRAKGLPPPAPSVPELTPAASPAVRWPIVALLRDACAPLGFLHGAGIVHRDLKPDNLFITDRGEPVLVDLGIAAGFAGAAGREVLAAEGAIVGTYYYMSPEQIQGELVDARADLYALGCILYECLTGSPPFTMGGPLILMQHLEDVPPPPSVRAPNIPRALDDLVLTLLEKRPEDRLGYAADVARRLDQALAASSPAPSTYPTVWPDDLPRPQPYLYRPGFTGRDAILHTLEDALSRTQNRGIGGLALLGGESGVGKTRLAMELGRLATQSEVSVITGQCRLLGATDAPASGAAPSAGDVRAGPLHPLRPLLLAIADRCQQAVVADAVLGARGKILAAYEPELATLPGQDQYPTPPSLDPDRARARLFDALADTLAAFADKPLLLILDDLQWADELTLGFLQALAQRITAHPVLVLGTYRSEERGAALDRLAAAGPGVIHFELGRLDDTGVRAMARGMLGLPRLPDDIDGFLVRTSNGNPYFIAEYLRAAMEAGLLDRDAAGQWRFSASAAALDRTLGLPRTLAALLDRRLRDLAPIARAVVEAAAILGRTVDGAVLGALVERDLDPNDVDAAAAPALPDATATRPDGAAPATLSALATLTRRQVLEEGDRGHLRFVHDKLREVAYARVPDARRKTLHRRAAQALEATSADATDVVPNLGLHWARAGVPDRAFGYFVRAAEQAAAVHAVDQAISFYDQALAQAEVPGFDAAKRAPQLRQVREAQGKLLSQTGEQERARSLFESVFSELDGDPIGRARMCELVGKAWEGQYDFDQALASYERAERCLGPAPTTADDVEPDADPSRDADWWRAWIQLQIGRIQVYYFRADLDSLDAAVAVVTPVIETRATPLQRARFYQSRVQRNLRAERYRPSAETAWFARRSLEGHRDGGDVLEATSAQATYAAVLLWGDDLDAAALELRAALDETERIGERLARIPCLVYTSMLWRRRGDVAAARRIADDALAAAQEVGMAPYAAAARATLGWAAWCAGDAETGAEQCREALASWRDASFAYPFQWLARWPLLAMARTRGEAADHARALLDPAQQRMPDDIDRALREALTGASGADAFAAATDAARAAGYL